MLTGPGDGSPNTRYPTNAVYSQATNRVIIALKMKKH